MLDAAAPKAGQEGDAEEWPGMTECRDERVQAWTRTRPPAATHAGPQLEARRTDSGGLRPRSTPVKKHGAYILLAGRCCSVREARDGECGRHAE